MSVSEVEALIGCVSGVIAILILFYAWTGKISSLGTKVDTLWEVYVMDALKDRHDLATHRSPFKLTDKALDLIPDDLKRKLSGIKDPEPWRIVQLVTADRLLQLANGNGVTIQNYVGMLVVYVKNHQNEEDKPDER